MKRTIRINELIISLLFTLIGGIAYSQQPGSIDLSFGHPVTEIGDSSRFGGAVYTVVVQPNDQKILAAGSFTTYNGVQRPRIVRLLPDGNVDVAFSTQASTAFSSGQVNVLALQPDGKILAGGTFTAFNASPRNRIVRINTDGSIDNSFVVDDDYTNPGGNGFDNAVNTIVLQLDGKILIGGNFTTYKNITANRMIRLNADGSIDGTFNIGTGFNGEVNSIAIDSDNRILVGGNFTSFNGVTNKNRIVRLISGGTLDSDFNIGTGSSSGCNGVVRKIVVQLDGRILLGGDFTSYRGNNNKHRLIRIAANGDLEVDNSFNSINGFNNNVYDIAIDDIEDKIIVAGNFTTFNGIAQSRICRLTSDGIIDSAFLNGSGVNNYTVYDIVIQTDQRILAVGHFTEYRKTIRNNIMRIEANGLLDNTLNVLFGFTDSFSMIKSIAIQQEDERIIVAGTFSRYNGVYCNGLIRLHPSGDIDSTFKIGLIGLVNNIFPPTVNIVKLDAENQKIYIGGQFSSYNGISRNGIARLNWDGSLDHTFNVQNGIGSDDYSVSDLLIQTDGKIVIGGDFYSYDGIQCGKIARIESNGALDMPFIQTLGTGFSNTVNKLALQPDGDILVCGSFYSFNGNNGVNRIARLTASGVLDETFSEGYSNLNVFYAYDIFMQPDEKILVGGNFYAFSNNYHLIRLNSNGTIDEQFLTNLETGFNNGTIYALSLDSDNKIIVGGSFTDFNGQTYNRILRLNNSGTLDAMFDVGAGFNETSTSVRSLAIQADGKILAGGQFSKYHNHFINNMVRIYGGSNCAPEFYPSTPTVNAANEVCTGTEISFNATSANATAYLWSYPNGWNANASGASLSITPQGVGTNSISVYAQNQCGQSAPQTFSIMVNTAPDQPTINLNGNELTCNQSGYGYQWFLNNAMIDGATEQTYTADEDGNYSVVVSNDCGSSQQSVSISVVVGIEEINALGVIKLYPNPANSNLTIRLTEADTADLMVYNGLGALVLQTKFVGSVHTLNVENFSAGLYVVKIESSVGLSSERLLIVE